MEKILFNNFLFGYILRCNKIFDFRGNIKFFTDDKNFLQIGAIKRDTGDKILPHYHNNTERIIPKTNEVLVIYEGKLLVNFYIDNIQVGDLLCEAGDILYLTDGAHGFEIKDKVKIIEIKQGPNLGINDKTKFYVS